jgi:uncharacterized protein GlcG (DUF336 family)
MRLFNWLLGRSRGRKAGKRPRRCPTSWRLNVEALEARTLLDAAGFVQKAYVDLLGRSASADPGSATFIQVLNGGQADRNQVAIAIQTSPEYRARQVQELYNDFLNRAADPGGLNAFTNFLLGGGTVEQLSAVLTGSDEYFQTQGGGTNAGFLAALYQDALERPIDPGGQAVFSQALGQGASRVDVAGVIFTSPEYRQLLVQDFFQDFLGRPADPGGLATFVGALQNGARQEGVVAAILASEEYAPGSYANSNQALNTTEVDLLLRRAAAASASDDAIIVIVDRGGRILGVRVEDGVSPAIKNDPANLIFAIDGALAKARTGAFFGNNEAPLTSRTIQFISQSTFTQREIESNPNISDPNSPFRGPGFVAAVGVKSHFPPGVPFTPQVDLLYIEHTNRDNITHPGADHILGTADDIPLPNRFNVADANLPANIPVELRLTPPVSYGVASGLAPNAQGRGIATLPGGIPIYKVQNGVANQVGGIGVFFPGVTGLATEENSALNVNFDRNRRDRSTEAEFIAFAALGGAGTVGSLGGIAPLPEIILPTGRIDLVGITLDIFGPGGAEGVNNLLLFSQQLGVGQGNPNSGSAPNPLVRLLDFGPDMELGTADDFVDPDGLRDGLPVPDGWLVTPHDSADGTITAADVVRIVEQGVQQANRTRAAIRLPLGTRTKMVLAVADRDGEILGLFRMPDATIFSIDVAVAKSRNVAYYSDPTTLQPIDQIAGVPPGVAFTNRTFRYVAQPRFPEGIDGAPPGPFSVLNDGGANLLSGLSTGAPLPASAHQSVAGFDAFNPGTNFRDPNNIANQNGIVFFPGSSALYKGVPGAGFRGLVGGFGVSGDGVDQDDVVTISGQLGFQAPLDLRADRYFVNGIRLPYQKTLRNPEG